MNNDRAWGKVYLVGAGTGNLGYLTLRGQELLSRAEVLIYDALVDEQLLSLVPHNCLKIDVGKRGGKNSTAQNEIDRLLVDYCLQGKQVVRLKSGDPLIFGRISEELTALTQNNCFYEIVPGISSILAAPLLAGIPLTDKNFSRSFAVISGHQPEIQDWQALARIDTLVIVMGARCLSEIIALLITNGKPKTEPVAIVSNCSRPEQQIFWGTLTDIVEKTRNIALAPAVIIIGKVVSFKDLDRTHILPLSGKTVLVTRAAEQSSQFSNLLQAQGATVLEMPALAITPPSSWVDLDSAIAHLANFQWLILTSANGVNYFFDRLATLGKDLRVLSQIKIAVVGKKTATVLKNYHLQPDFIPPDFIADSLVDNFPESLIDKRILFPRVETGGRELLVKELSEKGAKVTEVAVYQSRCPDRIDRLVWEALDAQKVDLVTFASSKTVKNFVELITKEANSAAKVKTILNSISIASIGPQTSQTCRELIGRVDIEAEEYTLEGLTTAIVARFIDK
jgi:uroporphyrinogen III methyltransferase/synthase